MGDFQRKPPFTAVTEDQVLAAYPPANPKMANGIGPKAMVNLLGDAVQPGFEQARVTWLDISSCGMGKFKQLKINRALTEPFLRALTEVGEMAHKLNYEIRYLGGQFFRYRNYKDTIASVKNGEHYLQTAKPWGDAKGRDWNSGWNVIAAEYDASIGKLDARLLSNHARGSAIDINPSENDLNSKVWDMPPEIVTIMTKHGFTWGGYYSIGGLDAMHFEYNLPTVDSARVFFPLGTPSKRESPARQLGQNERGIGGFFPMGRNRTLHGGAHVSTAASGKKEVLSCLAGTVVAVRLVAPGKGDDNPTVNEFTGDGSLCFVLVQHEIVPTKKEDGRDVPDRDKTFPIYSIYVHMASPTWAADDAYAKNVSWFKRLLALKNGAVVSLDATRPDTLGQTYAGASPIDPAASSFSAEGKLTFPARRKDKVIAVGKAMPADARQAIDALKAGATVTFDKPALPVLAGELIGYAESFVHWEIFSPDGDDGGIAKLLKLDSDLGGLFVQVKEADSHENNYLEVNADEGVDEVKSMLVDPLTGADKTAMQDILDGPSAGESYKRFLNGGAQFSRDAGRADDAGTKDKFTYPLKVTLSNDLGFKGPAEVLVKFTKGGEPIGKPGKITLGADKLQKATADVVVFVPDQADSMVLSSKELFLEEQAPVDPKAAQRARLDVFKDLVQVRYRNYALTHINEWTPKGLGALLDALSKEQPSPIQRFLDAVAAEGNPPLDVLKRKLRGITWWGRPKSSDDPFGEVPVLGAEAEEKSLFGDKTHLLPTDGKITCLHPVSALWLVDLLMDRNKLSVVDQWPEYKLARSEDLDTPVFVGWASAGDPARLGDTQHAFLVQHGYGSGGEVVFSVTPKAGGKPVFLNKDFPIPYDKGVARLPVGAYSFWGAWDLGVSSNGRDLKLKDPSQASLDFPKPTIAASDITVAPGAVTVTLQVKEKCPTALQGLAFLETTTETPGPDTKGTLAPVALPVVVPKLQSAKLVRKGITFEGEMITAFVRNKTEKVTNDFKIEQFAGDSSSIRIAFPLCQRVQALLDACRAAGGKTIVTPTVVSVGEDGLSVIVKPTKGVTPDFERLKTALEGLPASPLFSFSQVEGKEQLQIVYAPDVETGTLMATFDPGPVLTELLSRAAPPPGSKLYARPRLVFPRGGHMIAGAPKDRIATLEIARDAVDGLCDGDLFEITTTRWLPPVSVLGFGAMTYHMGDRSVIVEVELLGDTALWGLAKPTVKLTAGSYSKSAGKINGTTLTADFPITQGAGDTERGLKDVWGKPLSFSVEIGDASKLGGAKPKPPAPISVTATPSLDPLKLDEVDGVIWLRGKATFLPTSRNLVIVCEKQVNGAWVEDKKVGAKLKYTVKAGESAAGWCAPSGDFEAQLRTADVDPPMDPAVQYRFAWRRVSTNGAIWGTKIAEQIATYTPPQ